MGGTTSFTHDADGNETGTDYRKMLKVVLGSGYRGWIGVEYEGSKHTPRDGSRFTKQLLETIRDEMSA